MSDKPALIRDLPPLADWQKEAIERHYRERLRSLQAVAFGVERRQRETLEIDRPAGFDGVRTADHPYVRYLDGERELYELRRDPHQLENIAATADKALVQALEGRTSGLASCAGSYCRTLEDLPLLPQVMVTSETHRGAS